MDRWKKSVLTAETWNIDCSIYKTSPQTNDKIYFFHHSVDYSNDSYVILGLLGKISLEKKQFS